MFFAWVYSCLLFVAYSSFITTSIDVATLSFHHYWCSFVLMLFLLFIHFSIVGVPSFHHYYHLIIMLLSHFIVAIVSCFVVATTPIANYYHYYFKLLLPSKQILPFKFIIIMSLHPHHYCSFLSTKLNAHAPSWYVVVACAFCWYFSKSSPPPPHFCHVQVRVLKCWKLKLTHKQQASLSRWVF
jgi:hypothetical protein